MRALASSVVSLARVTSLASLASLVSLVSLVSLGGALGCSATSRTSSTGQGGGGGAGASGAGGAGNSGGVSFGGSGGGSQTQVGLLTGRVLAPEGSIGISGALVYLTKVAPEPIPDGVYCDRCVELDAGTAYALSGPDGTFTLPSYWTGAGYLVTQKGQFRRVRPIEVAGGDQPLDQTLTMLPGAMDKANGDDIPKMVVRVGQWDKIEDSLIKLGLGYDGSPSFTLQNGSAFLSDYDELAKYHVLFVPCSGSSGTDCNDFTSADATVKENLQKWVRAGGKLYVTDYSYDFVRQPFPGFVDWSEQTSEVGSACLSGSYDAPAIVEDEGLEAWLTANGITDFVTEASWTQIEQVNTQPGPDVDGNTVNITPKVWVSGNTGSGVHPTTISFEQQCGRVLFSTYHTEGNGTGFLPQEKALLYVLLEVAVCVGSPIPN